MITTILESLPNRFESNNLAGQKHQKHNLIDRCTTTNQTMDHHKSDAWYEQFEWSIFWAVKSLLRKSKAWKYSIILTLWRDFPYKGQYCGKRFHIMTLHVSEALSAHLEKKIALNLFKEKLVCKYQKIQKKHGFESRSGLNMPMMSLSVSWALWTITDNWKVTLILYLFQMKF